MMLTSEEIEIIESKIDHEGGLEGAFINYGLKVDSLSVQKAIDDFYLAHQALSIALEEAGVELA